MANLEISTLLPAGQTGESQLRAFYTYPETYPEAPDASADDRPRCWVRANMITSLDGGATDGATSGGLAGPGDRELFTLMRQACDVILVGAGTVRAEAYSGARFDAAQRRGRTDRGQAEIPPIAIVSGSGDLDPTAAVFSKTEVAPLILTSTGAADTVRRRLGGLAEVIDASGDGADDTVDPAAVLAELARRALPRVLCEGGPSLLGSLIDRDLLDELCLSIAPTVVGGSAGRIAAGPGTAHTPMRRTHLLGDEAGYLYTRYTRDVENR